MPNGTVIRGVPQGTSKDELLRKLQRSGYDTSALLRAAPPPAPSKPVEEESTISALGRAFQRGVPTISKGIAQITEDAPEIVASAFSALNPALGPVAGQVIRGAGRAAAKSDDYRALAEPSVDSLRSGAEAQLEALGPRKFKGVFEEEGLGRQLGSLAETVAESALPTVAGIATGVATRNPVAAGTVMSGGIVPMTYGGIRERQEQEGIDSVPRALLGTVASSALDVLTGVGGKVLSSTAAAAAREVIEGGLRAAVGRVLQTGASEAGTEMLQTVVEQVAGGSDPTTKQALLETLEGGLAGALGGTVFSGATEAATAPFRMGAQEGASETQLTPELQQMALTAADLDVERRVAAGQPREQAVEEAAANGRVYVDIATQLASADAPLTVEAIQAALPPLDPEAGAAPTAAPGTPTADTVAGAEPAGAGAGVSSTVPGDTVPPAAVQLDLPLGAGVEAGADNAVVGDGAQGPLDAPLTPETAPQPQTAPELLPIYEVGGNKKARVDVARPIFRTTLTGLLAESGITLPKKDITRVINNAASLAADRAARREAMESPVEILTQAFRNTGVSVAPSPAPVEAAAAPIEETPAPVEEAAAPVEETPAPEVPNIAQFAATMLEQAPAAATEMGVDPTYFSNAVRDVVQQREVSMTPEQLEQVAGPEAAQAYEAGRMWAEETMREQATPAPETAPEAAPEITPEAEPVAETQPADAEPEPDAPIRLEFDDNGVATVPGTDPRLGQLVSEMTKLMGIQNARPIVVSTAEAMEQVEGRLAPGEFNPAQTYRSLTRGARPKKDIGLGVKFSRRGTPVTIAINRAAVTNQTLAIEAIMHELGHQHMALAWEQAPPATREAVMKAYNRWLTRVSGMTTTEEFVGSTRTPRVTEQLLRNAPARVDQISNKHFDYMTSFDEWYADQVARWALTQDKPQNLVERFFKRVADRLRKFFSDAQGAGYMPDAAFVDYIEEVARTFPQNEQASLEEEVSIQEMRNELGRKLGLSKQEQQRILEGMGVRQRKARKALGTIQRTRDAADLDKAQINYGRLVRGDEEQVNLLRAVYRSAADFAWQTMLPTLTTADIFRILKGDISGLNTVDRIIRQDIRRYDVTEMGRIADETQKVADFLKKFPAVSQIISDLQFLTQAYNVDPRRAKTPEEYARSVDAKSKELQQKLVQEKDPTKRSTIKGQITRRLNEIKTVYEGGIPPDEDGKPLEDKPVLGWNDLARAKYGSNKGKQIFSMIADAHRRDLEEYVKALETRIREQNPGDEAKQAELLAELRKGFKPALDNIIYFPLMRHGDYFVRVGTGDSSILTLHETRIEMETRKLAARAAGQEVTDSGEVTKLREQRMGGVEADAALKKILDMLNDTKFSGPELRQQVFQMYLSTIPGNSIRARMATRKMRAGYNTDILKNFATARRSAVQARKGASFAYKVELGLSSASASVKGQPDQAKKDAFIDEIAHRVRAEMQPMRMQNGFINSLANLGNKAAFYWYLANPKSALLQLTQAQVVSLPVLSNRYGTAGAAAALTKYMGLALGKTAASPITAYGKDADGDSVYQYKTPTLEPTGDQGADKDLAEAMRKGWAYGRDLNVFMETFTADTITSINDPSIGIAESGSRSTPALVRATKRTGRIMASTFHQMERINREATYMAALELAYREARKKGVPHAKAMEQSQEEAVELALEATFDFSTYNKPSLFTTRLGGLGRLAFQFYMYPTSMLSLLVRNSFGAFKSGGTATIAAIKGDPRTMEAEAKQAWMDFRLAAGVMGNIMLWGGMTAVPFYGGAKLIAAALKDLLDDEDEEWGLSYIDPDTSELKWTYDYDWWFRNVWVPEFFGPDGAVASALGLDDETATMLARSAERGPISALTDLDMSNSMALDFLFFLPEEPRNATGQDAMAQYVYDIVTGAAGGVVQDLSSAWDMASSGRLDRAAEKAPRLIGNIPKALRFGREGQTNFVGDELIGLDAQEFTDAKVFAQMMGFSSTTGAQRMETIYAGRKVQEKRNAEKQDLFRRVRRLAVETYTGSRDVEKVNADYDKLLDDMVKFGEKYPDQAVNLSDLVEIQNEVREQLIANESTGGMSSLAEEPWARNTVIRRVNERQK